MKLSKEQIDTLFLFAEKKLVYHYDLQIEIVDHLAENIEEQMNADKTLTFENALQKVYSGFGIFGFARIVAEKTAQVQKRNRILWWQEVRELFGWPGILLSGMILSILWLLTSLIHINGLAIAVSIIAFGWFLILLLKAYKGKKPKKRLLIMNYYHPLMSMFPLIYLQVFTIKLFLNNPIAFVLITFLVIIFVIASLRLNEKVKFNAMRLFPEAFA